MWATPMTVRLSSLPQRYLEHVKVGTAAQSRIANPKAIQGAFGFSSRLTDCKRPLGLYMKLLPRYLVCERPLALRIADARQIHTCQFANAFTPQPMRTVWHKAAQRPAIKATKKN